MGRAVSDEEFFALLAAVGASALRLELQPAYDEPGERATVARFLAGAPQVPTEVESLAAWFAFVAGMTATGRAIRRVRVHEDPPTEYQSWERWIGAWNTQAGEDIRYLTRHAALDIGLLPAAGMLDWWLLDDAALIVMAFDPTGRRIRTELIDDSERVDQARSWWAMAWPIGSSQECDAGA